MKQLFFFLVVITFCSCNSGLDKKPDVIVADSTVAAPPSKKVDSVYWVENDSFYYTSAVEFRNRKPIKIFVDDGNHDVDSQLMAFILDTASIKIKTIPVEDEYKGSDDEDPTGKAIATYKAGRYTVTLKTWLHPTDEGTENVAELSINGVKMVAGKNLDTSATGEELNFYLALDETSFRTLHANGREWLYMEGYIKNCNGQACGYRYHLIYDPVTQRTMFLSQFRRADFQLGYDLRKKAIQFYQKDDTENAFEKYAFQQEGQLFLFNSQGRVVPELDEYKRPYRLSGYYRNTDYDTLYIIKGNLPDRKSVK